MKGMFMNCINLKNINNFFFSIKNIIDISYIFKNCENLNKTPYLTYLDLKIDITKKYWLSDFYDFYKNAIITFNFYRRDYHDILFIGTPDCNKSRIFLNYDFEIFKPKMISFEFYDLEIRYEDKNFGLRICDINEKEDYQSIINGIYRNFSLVVIVYAINNKDIYKSIKSLVEHCRINYEPNTKIFLIGNKINIDENK